MSEEQAKRGEEEKPLVYTTDNLREKGVIAKSIAQFINKEILIEQVDFTDTRLGTKATIVLSCDGKKQIAFTYSRFLLDLLTHVDYHKMYPFKGTIIKRGRAFTLQ